ncbi:alpha/beta hydrolase fold domain-containing protein [Oceanomicrobium pacificus]|uniref:Alpha/beta hydrolase fold domain-containing protein n=1 Tax=Oceanomicrobium pacificus TaxID=2692916 RepID=A0A6B0TV92_9RHOB|nr:alpha/beta hydrolase fold domain-containing protein [Oceanomicrobium pacificus]MXU64883.1 alpha/beta hydrolase fold domain-containing protein [Oceanomicrobium pacificus]
MNDAARSFAPGMAAAIARAEQFQSPEEAAAFWSEGGPAVETVDLTYTGGAGQSQRLRLYRGGGADALTLLYIHGGGWTGGSIELQDRSARGLAVLGGINVVSISYRLAPARPYPAGLEDCLAALDWITSAGKVQGLNGARVAAGGASAGANLAAAVALARPGRLSGLLLFYGVLGADFDTDSYRRYADGYGLTRARMIELFDMYDPAAAHRADPLMVPLASDALDGLPPTVVIAAELDVLLDDSRAFAAALAQAGTAHEFHIEPGVTHGFINRGRLVPSADRAVARAAGFLKQHA